jgi:hypothetical protein
VSEIKLFATAGFISLESNLLENILDDVVSIMLTSKTWCEREGAGPAVALDLLLISEDFWEPARISVILLTFSLVRRGILDVGADRSMGADRWVGRWAKDKTGGDDGKGRDWRG